MKLYIIAGANGSGKTTFASSFSEFNNLAFINADEIAKSLNPTDLEKEKIKAGRIFLKEINILLEKKSDMIIETTMSGKYLINIIENAKNIGYKIVIFYLFLENVHDNIARVRNRVVNGGHDIPKNDIIRRFYRSKKLFWNTYRMKADNWYLFFNADDEFEEVANYADGEMTISHKIYYERFIEELHENPRKL